MTFILLCILCILLAKYVLPFAVGLALTLVKLVIFLASFAAVAYILVVGGRWYLGYN